MKPNWRHYHGYDDDGKGEDNGGGGRDDDKERTSLQPATDGLVSPRDDTSSLVVTYRQ